MNVCPRITLYDNLYYLALNLILLSHRLQIMAVKKVFKYIIRFAVNCKFC